MTPLVLVEWTVVLSSMVGMIPERLTMAMSVQFVRRNRHNILHFRLVIRPTTATIDHTHRMSHPRVLVRSSIVRMCHCVPINRSGRSQYHRRHQSHPMSLGNKPPCIRLVFPDSTTRETPQRRNHASFPERE